MKTHSCLTCVFNVKSTQGDLVLDLCKHPTKKKPIETVADVETDCKEYINLIPKK